MTLAPPGHNSQAFHRFLQRAPHGCFIFHPSSSKVRNTLKPRSAMTRPDRARCVRVLGNQAKCRQRFNGAGIYTLGRVTVAAQFKYSLTLPESDDGIIGAQGREQPNCAAAQARDASHGAVSLNFVKKGVDPLSAMPTFLAPLVRVARARARVPVTTLNARNTPAGL